jgi:hypothetical protein
MMRAGTTRTVKGDGLGRSAGRQRRPAAPASAHRGMPGSLLGLQRAIGNGAVARLIQRCRDGHT